MAKDTIKLQLMYITNAGEFKGGSKGETVVMKMHQAKNYFKAVREKKPTQSIYIPVEGDWGLDHLGQLQPGGEWYHNEFGNLLKKEVKEKVKEVKEEIKK